MSDRAKNAQPKMKSAARLKGKSPKPPKGSSKSVKQRPVTAWVGGPGSYYVLLIGVAILIGIGVLMVASASSAEAVIAQSKASAAQAEEAGLVAGLSDLDIAPFSDAIKHLAFILAGITMTVVVGRINYRHLAKFAFPAGVTIGVLLLLVLIPGVGTEVNYARRWIEIAGFQIQPSEFAKPILLYLGALTFYRQWADGQRAGVVDYWSNPTAYLVIAGSILAIIVEPDTGTSAIIVVGLAVAWLMLSLPIAPLARTGVIAVVAALVKWGLFDSGYRGERVNGFLARWFSGAAPADQVWQAELALGSGGLTGVGPGQGSQKYSWLYASQNDFILAIIGEELGLFGTLTVLGGFALILWGGVRIALYAKDPLGRALAGGALSMLMAQAVLNVYSVIGLGPVTGKPLPFITLGGSAMLGAFGLLGIIASVARFGSQAPSEADTAAVRAPRPLAGDAVAETASSRGTGVTSRYESAPKRSRRTSTDEPTASRRTASTRIDQRPEESDEDSLEWRWDGGAHLPRSRDGR